MASSAVPPATLICVGRPLAGAYWYSTVCPAGSVTCASCPEAVYSYAVYALALALSYRRVIRPLASRAKRRVWTSLVSSANRTSMFQGVLGLFTVLICENTPAGEVWLIPRPVVPSNSAFVSKLREALAPVLGGE